MSQTSKNNGMIKKKLKVRTFENPLMNKKRRKKSKKMMINSLKTVFRKITPLSTISSVKITHHTGSLQAKKNELFKLHNCRVSNVNI